MMQSTEGQRGALEAPSSGAPVDGVLRVGGWVAAPEDKPQLTLHLDGEALDAPISYLPASPLSGVGGPGMAGFLAWIDVTPLAEGAHTLTCYAQVGDQRVVVGEASFRVHNRANPYWETFSAAAQAGEVMGRDSIYCSGPPNEVANALVLDLIQQARAGTTLLDFGCGIGVYVEALQKKGVEAWGLEVSAAHVARGLALGRRVAHYDGFTIPHADDSFDTVTAIEVLEHIPHWERSLAEILRVARRRVILSVPNIESVTRMAPHLVVPWHLLESTHVNFFTPDIMAHQLSRIPNIAFRVFTYGGIRLNGTVYDNHICAVIDLAGTLEGVPTLQMDYLDARARRAFPVAAGAGGHMRSPFGGARQTDSRLSGAGAGQITDGISDIRPMSLASVLHRIKLHYDHGGVVHLGKEILRTLRRKITA
ncbi:MAG: class I SAM-dependent methyltransferase [Litorilinea sp.]